MSRKSVLLVGLGMLLMPSVIRAQAIVVDQSQYGIDASRVYGIYSGQKLSQTVTAGAAGQLIGIFLPVGCDSGVLSIEIRVLDTAGKPGSTVLWRRRILAGSVPSIGATFRLFPIDLLGRGLPVLAGDRFAVVLENSTGTCGWYHGPDGDPYSGGSGFYDGGSGWIPVGDFGDDLPFFTLVSLR